jgi:hypothetical protein
MRAAHPSTLRSAEVTLLNQRLPGPSVYDDWIPSTDRHARSHRALWIALVFCLLAGATAAGVLLERWNLHGETGATSVTTGVAK